MSTKYSIRELLLIVLIFALVTGLAISALENSSLNNKLAEVRELNEQLDLESKRFASYVVEMDHFSALANGNFETIDVLLDAHRRKSASNLRMAEIQFGIDRLLDNADDSDLQQRKSEILNSEIAESRRIIAEIESKPQTSAQQVTHAKQQLVYFKTQAEEVAK